jgi:3-deoxy-7-phosphoheptulonate synthase
MGLMIESNLHEGNQKLVDPKNLTYGVSVTDACIDWDTTTDLLKELDRDLRDVLPERRRHKEDVSAA